MIKIQIEKLNYSVSYKLPDEFYYEYEAGSDIDELVLEMYVKESGEEWVKEVIEVLGLEYEVNYDPEDILRLMEVIGSEAVSNGESNKGENTGEEQGEEASEVDEVL